MIQSRRHPPTPSTTDQAFLVAMGETLKQSSLLYAEEEIERVRKSCHAMSLTQSQWSQAGVKLMWDHICHGARSPISPATDPRIHPTRP